ncbi:MAG TPA: MASE1 domain-containing protein [Candidatus Dormibacteraeota bacterium]|nr:MASE1 domain-containing protein [Candidatus Dormibacteraeota bacterium]
MRSHAAYALRLAGVAVVYFVAARLSLGLALVHGQVTPIWPPTGIALVAILTFGRRMWPAIAIAALATNLPIGPTPLAAAAIAAGNTIAPLTSAELLRRVGFHLDVDRMRDALAIVFLGALLGMTISATFGTAVLTLSGAVATSQLAATWAVWWAGDAMGVLLVAPFLLSFWPHHGVQLTWPRRVELTAMLAVVALVTYFLFENKLRLEYLVLPLIAVGAWRFRLRGAAPAALTASLVAGWSAVHGYGPFQGESLFEKMVTLQVFNVSVSLASFVLAAYANARDQREQMSNLYRGARLAMAAKTDAIDVAANELGPPVAVLTSYLAILSEGKLGPPPAKWRSILNVMADKAWQIDRIINDLVDAARIEAEQQAPNRGHVDLREIVRKAVDRARPRAEITGARIALKLAAEPVLVEGDARQIGRILDNLINNGLTYVSRPPRLKVEARSNGAHALVHVTDNGVGMSTAERDRVFEPFRRTTDPAFRSIPGVGLGLYASQQLAEVNQGRLILEKTEPGVGSSFALELPLSKAKPPR